MNNILTNLLVALQLISLGLAATNKLNSSNGNKDNKPMHPKLAEFNRNAHLRPTKCHICRVLVTELQVELRKTEKIKDTLHLSHKLDDDNASNQKSINYQTSELRLMDSLENVCQNTQRYRAIAGPEFPYIKGVKSMFQTELENMMGNKALKMQLDAPQAIIDDPTLEIRRLGSLCNQMIENHEEDIEDWYMNNHEEDPLYYICAEKVLKGSDTDCLTASTVVPDYATKPLPDDTPSILHTEL
ncbi:protein canopy 4-like [Rhopilema esculentum]|uniref:protein canopy 4-like n=1 Tax=Rhopilema esculentum TaxID=499914 RepID=UPI0031D44141|eukprot:gene14537-5604_t